MLILGLLTAQLKAAQPNTLSFFLGLVSAACTDGTQGCKNIASNIKVTIYRQIMLVRFFTTVGNITPSLYFGLVYLFRKLK